jgi:hypothetical protein
MAYTRNWLESTICWTQKQTENSRLLKRLKRETAETNWRQQVSQIAKIFEERTCILNVLSVAAKASWSSQIAEKPEEGNPRIKLKTTGFADCRNFWRKKLHTIRAIRGGKSKLEKNFVVGKWCRRYRSKQQLQHLLLLLTKRDTKFVQASQEIAERELHSEDLPQHKNAAQAEKCPIQNEIFENSALESFPRECSNVAFPTLKRGVFHDVTRFKGLRFRVRACPGCSIILLNLILKCRMMCRISSN